MPVRVCLLVVLMAGVADAEDPKDSGPAAVKKAAKAGAEKLQAAILKGDFETLAEYTHPALAKEAGGKEKLAEVAAAGVAAMKEKGFGFESVKAADPADPIKVGDDLYTVVPVTVVMTAPGGRIKGDGSLVGVSSDGGKSWTYLDTSAGRKAVKKLLPALPDALVIPGKKKPVFEKDED